jgi:hypothetical protein
MTDSTTELDEAQAEADEEDEVDDSDDELDMDKLSLEDRKVIPGCTLLIKTCGSLAGQVRLCITVVAYPTLTLRCSFTGRQDD